MKILQDNRQKNNKHIAKNRYFFEQSIYVYTSQLPFGDYWLFEPTTSEKATVSVNTMAGKFHLAPKVAVDTKADICELAYNICSTKAEHERFKAELIKAQEHDCQLVILVENTEGVSTLADLTRWKEPQKHFNQRHGIRRYFGSTLAKACNTMNTKYGVKFAFCAPEDAGAKIISILTKGAKNG